MGNDFKRTQDEEMDDDTVEKLNDLADRLNDFGDKVAKATADARTAIEKKKEVEDADSTKKKSNDSQDSKGGGDDMDFDVDDVTSAIDKMIALKGDMKLSEAKEFIEENEETVKEFI